MSADVEQFLDALDRSALRTLVLEMASYSAEAMRALGLRAGSGATARDELLGAVDTALAGLDLDYYDEFDWDEADDGVQAVDEVLDELQRHLDDGAHDGVRPALQYLLTRLGELGQSADNADALVGVDERACELFGRAAAGHSDSVALARWVVGFRVTYRGWPSLTLDAVAHAFNGPAWDAYRVSIAELEGGGPGADPFHDEVDRMLLELADHDGNVDAAVALLSAPQRPYFGGIVQRLRAAGRHAEALAWLDRAAARGCVDFAWRAGHAIVPAEDATRAYLDGGRPDGAVAVSRTLFERDLSVDAYRLLCGVAKTCGCLEAQRTWAIELATHRALRLGGDHLIRLHLADGNVAQAWEAADAFGAHQAWRELVDASETGFPLPAGRMCFAQALEQIKIPNSKLYPSVVALIVKARSLYHVAGQRAEADVQIATLREAYRRRPALMAEMNRARLPT